MPDDSLPVSGQLRLEEICARFEAAWQAAGTAATAPRMEEYLGAAAEPERLALLRELLCLDVHYRRRHGENPDAKDYGVRCPAHAQVIPTLFAELLPVVQMPRQAATISARAAADRNLLFGILALQMDFIRRDALVNAMNAWVLAKAKSLGQILLEQGQLTRERLQLLDALVAEHLRGHGGDCQQSLASVAVPASVRQELSGLGDGDVQASLCSLAAAGADAAATTSPYVPDPGDGSAAQRRYRILRPHAKGGLGEVFVAEDQELSREVALKEIQTRYADDPQSRGRFLQEAEITGGLEHPGVVPVYGLGRYEDGRPFYAMRFIRGDNLKEAIHRFHHAHGPCCSPGERRLALRGLLGRFVDVCNAVAYAHSRGVLHRDLKPGNIMLGKYGETLVVDWGLAKAVGRAAPPVDTEELTLRPRSGDGAAATQLGTAVGTPAYMSPEQAAGRLDLLGHASDIYSLGATLFALLTGRPPVEGQDPGEVLRRVQRGETRVPRQVKPDTPAGLDAICRKAMAPRPEDRYATALDLARDVEHWMADEPVSAYPEPWRMRAGRWIRRHPAPVSAAAAAVLVTALLGGGGWVWLAQVRAERRAETVQAVNKALDEATLLRGQAQAAPVGDLALWGVAREAARRAEVLAEAGAADDETSRRVRTLFADLAREEQSARDRAGEADRDRKMLERLAEIRGTVEDHDGGYVNAAYAAAFRDYGIDVDALPTAEAADRIRRRPQAVAAELAATLDLWAFERLLRGSSEASCQRLREVARAADDDPWRKRLREGPKTATIRTLQELRAEGKLASLPVQSTFMMAIYLRGAGDPEAAVSLLQEAQQHHPNDIWINFYLAHFLQEMVNPPRTEDAIRFYTAARALRPETGHALAHLLAAQGKTDEAIAVFRDLIRRRPATSEHHCCLAKLLAKKGSLDEAIAAYKEASRLAPTSPIPHLGLGVALQAKGAFPEAIAALERAVQLDPGNLDTRRLLGLLLQSKGALDQAITTHKETIRLRPNDSLSHLGLGAALEQKGQLDEAIAAYKQATRVEPGAPLAHYALGCALQKKGEVDGAVAALSEAVRLDPNSASYHRTLGALLCDRKQAYDAALAQFREAIRLQPDFAEAYCDSGVALIAKGAPNQAITALETAVRLKPSLANAHRHLGRARLAKGDVGGAIAAFREAIRLEPSDAMLHNLLGNALGRQGMLDEAIAALREALRLKPDDAATYALLGEYLLQKGLLSEAVTAYRNAIRLRPDYQYAYMQLGALLHDKVHDADGALAAFQSAVHLTPNDAWAHYCLGNAWSQKGASDEALAAYRQALRLAPNLAEAHCNLGQELKRQGQYTEALAAFRRGHELGIKQPRWRYASDKWVKECERLVELDGKLSAVLRGEATPADAAERIEYAELCKGKGLYGTSARLYREAFVAQPELAGDPAKSHRYNAACYAALAGCGRGKDIPPLDEDARSGWRKQALEWLRADLGLRTKQLGSGKPGDRLAVWGNLLDWQRDPALAGLREEAALSRLPTAEREACRKLWAEVDELRVRSGSPK
jgi:tetratricopeptide (TPR) repeat protein/tRNA A-37 threonylcarbamoyl transferase component Bud32